jgi:preprotein translocase SecE subunit
MNPAKALTNYLRSCVEEAKKVAWPSRQDTIRFSALVIGVSFIVAVFFGALDAGFTKIVTAGLESRQQAAQTAPVANPDVNVTPTTEPVAPTVDLNQVQPIVTPTNGATP